MVAALWDDRLHGLRYAQDRGLPYLSISSGLADIAPEVVAGAQRAYPAPLLLAGHYCAGTVVLAALHSARRFDRIDTVRISALTATGIALGVERLLGLRGEPVPPGIHTPRGTARPGLRGRSDGRVRRRLHQRTRRQLTCSRRGPGSQAGGEPPGLPVTRLDA
ncbi:hypothetical protein [Streptomyces arboris]|uniref:hypothetical protein n=1 Tax=Streptomyces arboris TaxID=2600619 RepID=UPI00363A1DFC